MDTSSGGTAIMLAIAALLWFFYLVPTWLRRREYLATERTATRLQQTIRVLAETAELPDEVRITATAREAARQERLLRTEQRRADAMAAREAATMRREQPAGPAPRLAPEVLRRRRMRRTRRLASILMIGATVAALGQLWLITTTGMSPVASVVLIASVVAGGLAIAVQRRLDVVAMPRASAPARARTAVSRPVVEAETAPASWTPREIPKPMYLSRPVASRPAAEFTPLPDLQAALLAAAADAERTLRAAHAAPEVVQLRGRTPSRYAGMGVLGPDATETPDLDEVLRRRRSAG